MNALSVQNKKQTCKGGLHMSKKQEKKNNQPQPLSGSKKVKNKNHSRQNNNPGHGM